MEGFSGLRSSCPHGWFNPYNLYIVANLCSVKALFMDIIFIRDLRIDTVIGIYDWERAIKQTIHLDLEMATDIARAAATDHIDDTLNYKAVSKRVIAFVEESSFQLVETLAERIVQLVLTEFDVPWMRLILNKGGAVRGAQGVGVIIERSNGS
ncbi:Dihydroneopterin aldolase [hydrothermal vent metagenome]|uniref:dihydroneopterin aldolase n=1 Tax=hydrothermal vent metagenome TaxID=652676 RepID=A0A3B0YUH7_9ZZZZ